MSQFTRAALIFLIPLVPLLHGSSGYSETIEPSDRQCKVDEDCVQVTVGCGCIHNSTCAGPGDKAAGVVDAVHRKHAGKYVRLAECTPEETKACAGAGACPSRGAWIPKCQAAKCLVVFKPRTD